MKYQIKSILLWVIFFMFLTLIVGCDGFNPILPEIVPDPNPAENPANSTVSYIKVTASSSTIQFYQSQKLVVRGYNSDDEWIILDKTKLKMWTWGFLGQCPTVFEPYITLTPQSGSLTTTFTSGATGTFYIGAVYQENVGGEIFTDDVAISVAN